MPVEVRTVRYSHIKKAWRIFILMYNEKPLDSFNKGMDII